MPASSAAWMMRMDSSWSVLPQSPNIIAPRHRGLTLTPVVPRLRSSMAPHLVDRREAGVETIARGAQVQAPDANTLRPGKADRLVEVVVESLRPMAERLRVVVAEVLDVLDLEPRPFERERDARQVQGVGVGEDEALGERAGVGVGVSEPRDAVVQQAAAGLQQRCQLLGVDVDLLLADVLDHADAGDCVVLLSAELPVIRHADVCEVIQSRFVRSSAGEQRLGL